MGNQATNRGVRPKSGLRIPGYGKGQQMHSIPPVSVSFSGVQLVWRQSTSDGVE